MILVARGPGFIGLRLPHPPDLPSLNDDFANSIYALANQAPTAQVLSIPDKEREALMQSMAQTFTRALYHAGRFDIVLRTLVERWTSAGGATHDDCASAVLFEATSLMVAARSAVDEVLYIAARRAGVSSNIAAEWSPHRALTCNLSVVAEYDIPEVHALRNHLAWYEDLNAYRNALTHHGWKPHFRGYFPPSSTRLESKLPKFNLMLVPDRTSLGRSRRGHEWTFTQGRRLEDLVQAVRIGLESFMHDIGTIWGAKINRGTAPEDMRFNVLVELPHVVLAATSDLCVPVFTSREKAIAFQKTSFAALSSIDLFEMLPTSADEHGGAGFWFWLPGGEQCKELAENAGPLAPESSLILSVDPIGRADTSFAPGRELFRHPVQCLCNDGEGGLHVKICVAGADRVYVWRRTPDLP